MSAHAAKRFASRGGDKLDGALDALSVDVRGLRVLDAGASTGGFTDCLLQRGAREVVAVDVAYGALDWRLRNDPRVVVVERTNVRAIEPADIGGPVDLAVADLSFISLSAVADALMRACGGDLVLMVKPQFELPRDRVPRGGVVHDRDAWADACRAVASVYRSKDFRLRGVAPSPITGPKGNREFFLHFSPNGEDGGDELIAAAIEAAP